MRSLAEELGKKRPFDLVEEEALLAIVRTGAVLQAQHNRLLRQRDLTHASYNILRILRGAGEGGRCVSEIAAHVVTEVPDMTRLIDRLEKLGLLARRRVDADRRKVRIFVTQEGLALLAGLDRPLRALLRQQFAKMPAADVRALVGLLGEVRESAAGVAVEGE